MHNVMAYETLAPHAFSARWADRLMASLKLASAVLPCSRKVL